MSSHPDWDRHNEMELTEEEIRIKEEQKHKRLKQCQYCQTDGASPPKGSCAGPSKPRSGVSSGAAAVPQEHYQLLLQCQGLNLRPHASKQALSHNHTPSLVYFEPWLPQLPRLDLFSGAILKSKQLSKQAAGRTCIPLFRPSQSGRLLSSEAKLRNQDVRLFPHERTYSCQFLKGAHTHYAGR